MDEAHFDQELPPPKSHKELGTQGEDLAVQYLEDLGYQIIQKNFRNPFGEIDIIAMDHKTICFIEVKTRLSDDFGSPLEAIHKAKQRQLGKMALCYLEQCEREWEAARFDVVGIKLYETSGQRIELIKNAFEHF